MSRIDDIVANAYRELDRPPTPRERRAKRAKQRTVRRLQAAKVAYQQAIKTDVCGDANRPENRGRRGDNWGRTGYRLAAPRTHRDE